MKLSIKRVYEPEGKNEGERVLVDRLWPRGITKEKAHIDVWAKELAPSNALRSWYHRDPGKYEEFEARYMKELDQNTAVAKDLIKKKKIVLVTSVREIEHSHVPILVTFLEKLL